MHKISVEKECGCFKRSDLENNIIIENKDDALVKALGMSNTMNEDFCGKHEFQVMENANNFIIRLKQETQPKSSGCCGGGCGTH